MKFRKSFLLIVANALSSIAYRQWTFTNYFETHRFSITTNSDPCETVTSTDIITATVITTFTATLPNTYTHCPGYTIKWDYDVVEVTPTTTVQGIATNTYTNTYGVYGPVFTVVNVAVELPMDALPVPSMAITTPATFPTQDSSGQWRLNGTPVQFVQPVLLTPPASCHSATITTFLATYTQSAYSFTSLVSIEPSQSGIIPQVVAAAVSTQFTVRTYEDLSTMTTIQYVLPSGLFPVTSTASEYWSAADINPCIDPRATALDATTTTTKTSSSEGGIRTLAKQAVVPVMLAAIISMSK